MPLINVNFSTDEAYRYKMEIPQIRHEGAGNGRRTAIENLKKIAEAIKRPADELRKNFEIALGAISQGDSDDNYYWLTGFHDAQSVTKALRTYIFSFVICKSCGNPETVPETFQKKQITYKCGACGKTFEVKGEKSKLAKWIIKQHEIEQGGVQQKGRRTMAISLIVSKLSGLVDQLLTNVQEKKPEEQTKEIMTLLKNQINQFLDDEDLRDEEVPAALLAAIFSQHKPSAKFARDIQFLFKDQDLISENVHIYYLYGLECLIKKYNQQFIDNKDLLNIFLQQSSFLKKDVYQIYRGEQAEPFVPEEFHEECLRMAQDYFDLLDEDEGEQEEEAEQEAEQKENK